MATSDQRSEVFRRTSSLKYIPIVLLAAASFFLISVAAGIVALFLASLWAANTIGIAMIRLEILESTLTMGGGIAKSTITQAELTRCRYHVAIPRGRALRLACFELFEASDIASEGLIIGRYGWGHQAPALFRALRGFIEGSPAQIDERARDILDRLGQ